MHSWLCGVSVIAFGVLWVSGGCGNAYRVGLRCPQFKRLAKKEEKAWRVQKSMVKMWSMPGSPQHFALADTTLTDLVPFSLRVRRMPGLRDSAGLRVFPLQWYFRRPIIDGQQEAHHNLSRLLGLRALAENFSEADTLYVAHTVHHVPIYEETMGLRKLRRLAYLSALVLPGVGLGLALALWVVYVIQYRKRYRRKVPVAGGLWLWLYLLMGVGIWGTVVVVGWGLYKVVMWLLGLV